MTQPTSAQLASARVTAPDAGGRRTHGWGAGRRTWPAGHRLEPEHGDLRVPHFVGLHAIQFVPLFAWLATRRITSARKRERATLFVGVGYAGVFAILLAQALAGEPVARAKYDRRGRVRHMARRDARRPCVCARPRPE